MTTSKRQRRNGATAKRRRQRRRRPVRELTPLQQAINNAVKIAGSQVMLARACCVTSAAITKARRTNRISPTLALNIHLVTGVPRHALRPDLWDA